LWAQEVDIVTHRMWGTTTVGDQSDLISFVYSRPTTSHLQFRIEDTRRFTGTATNGLWYTTLAILPRHLLLLQSLQPIMNAAMLLQVWYSVRKYDHITPLLRDFHYSCALHIVLSTVSQFLLALVIMVSALFIYRCSSIQYLTSDADDGFDL